MLSKLNSDHEVTSLLVNWVEDMFKAINPKTSDEDFRKSHNFTFSVRLFLGEGTPEYMKPDSLSYFFSFGLVGDPKSKYVGVRNYFNFIGLVGDSSLAKVIHTLEEEYKSGTVTLNGEMGAGKDWDIDIIVLEEHVYLG